MATNNKNFAANLKKIGKQLSKLDLTRPLAMSRVQCESDLLKNWKSGKSPNGVSWKPRKYPKPWPILTRTGHLRNSHKFVSTRDTLSLSYSAKYAKYVNVSRKILPVGVPKSWQKIVTKNVQFHVNRIINHK